MPSAIKHNTLRRTSLFCLSQLPDFSQIQSRKEENEQFCPVLLYSVHLILHPVRLHVDRESICCGLSPGMTSSQMFYYRYCCISRRICISLMELCACNYKKKRKGQKSEVQENLVYKLCILLAFLLISCCSYNFNAC